MMKSKKNIITSVIGTLVILLFVIVYGYSLERKTISAVLQYQTNLENPQSVIYAVVTKPQKLPNGKTLQNGARLIGQIQKTNNNFEIHFHTVQLANGKKENFSGKTTFNSEIGSNTAGISSKIGKTINEQSRKNVLGAIFGIPESSKPEGLVLQRGSTLLIETN